MYGHSLRIARRIRAVIASLTAVHMLLWQSLVPFAMAQELVPSTPQASSAPTNVVEDEAVSDDATGDADSDRGDDGDVAAAAVQEQMASPATADGSVEDVAEGVAESVIGVSDGGDAVVSADDGATTNTTSDSGVVREGVAAQKIAQEEAVHSDENGAIVQEDDGAERRDTVSHTQQNASTSENTESEEREDARAAQGILDDDVIEEHIEDGAVTALEVRKDVAITVDDLSVELADATVIENFDAGAAVDPADITAAALDDKAVDALADTYEELTEPVAAAEFGIPGEHLVFSKPVKMTIAVDMADGEVFVVKAYHEGEGISTKGITQNPDAQCRADGSSTDEDNKVTVRDGAVTFYTCGASIFIIDPNQDGTQDALLWLKADAGLTVSGGAVSTWADQSGNGNNVSQTDAGRRPTVGTMNFNPALSFNADFLYTDTLSFTLGTGAREYFAVSKSNVQTGSNAFGVTAYFGDANQANNQKNIAFGVFDPVNAGVVDGQTIYTSGGGANATEWYRDTGTSKTVPGIYGYRAPNNTTLSQYTLAYNGKTLPTPLLKNNSADADFVPNVDASNKGLVIAAKQSTSGGVKNAFLKGLISEVILYDRVLTNAERRQVTSYLAVKYGISVDQSTEQDYVFSDNSVFWAATNNAYDCNIFGIAKDAGWSLDQRISKSQTVHTGVDADIITVSTDANFVDENGLHSDALGEKEFFMVGNDCAPVSMQTTELDTSKYSERVAREWRVERSSGTTVNMKFDGFDDRWALITAPGNFGSDFSANTTEVGRLNANGEIFNVDINSGKRFTLARVKQPAPGGEDVNLALWLKADDNGGVTTDGTALTTWVDKSGAGNDATAVGAPQYRDVTSAWLNFNPSVALDGAADGFTLPNHTFSVNDENYTYYAVFKKPLNTNLNTLIFTGRDATNQWVRIHVDADGSVDDRFNNVGVNNGTPGKVLAGVPALTTFRYDTAANAKTTFVAGGQDGSVTANNKATADQNHIIGYGYGYQGSPTTPQDFFEGNLAELVAYVNTAHDDATRNKVESYLALKYGITLDQSAAGGGQPYTASDGTEVWTPDASDTFEHDIFGIGRDDEQLLHQKISKSVNSDALVTIATDYDFASLNTSASRRALGDGQFLVIANNDAAIAWTTAGAPSGRQVLARTWKVQEKGGDTGDIYMSVPDDSASSGAKLPADYGVVYLLVDADGDFSSGATEYVLVQNGDVWELQAPVNFADGTYFTFATVSGLQVSVDATDDVAIEGSANSGSADNGVFTVTMSAPLPVNVNVQYAVSGSATAGADYTALTGSVTIPAGDTSATITVDAGAYDDPALEGDEHVVITLTGTDNGGVGVDATQDTATILITDDETDPTRGGTPVELTVAATDNAAAENPADTGAITFSLSSAVTENVTVTYSVGGGATAGADYTALTGSVTIPAGSTGVSVTIDTNGYDDALREGDEYVIVTLVGNSNGGVIVGSQDTATVTIVDDETDPTRGGTPVVISIAATDDRAVEGAADTGLFTVTMDAQMTEDVVVNYTVTGTATAGADYTALTGSVTIPAGDTSATITVDAGGSNDALVEGDETVEVTLSAANNSGASVDSTPATVTIHDDESATVTVERTTDAVEPNHDGAFAVTLSQSAEYDVVVSYTVSGTATAGADYTALTGSVTIPAGDTSANIPVTVIDDALFEGLETVIVTLTATDNAVISADTTPATVSISDDEGTINPVTATLTTTTNGDENGPTAIIYTVTLSTVNNTGADITFDTAFTGGSATAGDDYTDVSGPATMTIADGTDSATLTVPVIDDALWDDTETVTLTISNSSNGRITIAGASATATIADNDSAPTAQTITIFSDNADTTLATTGDVITLEVTFSDAVQNVAATIAGVSGTATNIGGNAWRITIPALTGGEPEGVVAFQITAQSLGGGAITPATATTDGTSVTIDFTPPQEPQINEPDPGDKVTNPTPTSGNCGTDADHVEFTTTPSGGLNPDPQILPLDADGNWNGLLTWNTPLSGSYDLLVSCVDKAGNKKTKTISPITPITDPTAKKLTLDGGNTFVEADANDGTIRNSILVNVSNAHFAHAGGMLTPGTDFTVANVPAGHTLTVAISADGTRAVLTLNGAATAHENNDDVTNIELVFADSAFADATAADVLNSALVLGADYFSANGGGRSSGALTYSGFFKEDVDNTGVMRTSGLGSVMEIALGGGARFADTLMAGTDVMITNVPAGLTPQIARVDDTHLRLTLTGAAASHDPADSVANLTIAFADSAFDGATRAEVAQSIYPFGEVRFIGNDDDDGDGASNDDEDGAYNGGDGNGDGIQDRKQQNVASVKNPVTGGTFTVEAKDGPCDIVSDVRGYAEGVLAVQDADGDYPIGLFGFRLECPQPGGSETVRIYLDRVYADSGTWTVRKFHPASGVYTTLSPQPTIGTVTLQNGPQANTDVTYMEFTLTDGEPATDTDTLRDRFITDPHGPALPIIRWETQRSTTGEGGSVTVTARSSFPLPQAITIPLTLGGTADSADYTPALTTLAIGAGESDASVTLRFATDGREEGEETLTITLADGVGYATDEMRTHTVTITDNPDDAVSLDKPSKVRVKCSAKGYAKVTWRDKARGEDGYKVYRRTIAPHKSAWTRVKTLRDEDVESYKDRGPFAPGVTYEWRVRSYEGDARGEWSKKVRCTFPGGGDDKIVPGGGTGDPEPIVTPTGDPTSDPIGDPTSDPQPVTEEVTAGGDGGALSGTSETGAPSAAHDTTVSSGNNDGVRAAQCGDYWILWVLGLIVVVILLTLFPTMLPVLIIVVLSIIVWWLFDACRSYWWMPLLSAMYAVIMILRGFVVADDEEETWS